MGTNENKSITGENMSHMTKEKIDQTTGRTPSEVNQKTEKAKPWSKVTERKTAPHILQRRKDQYYAKKRIAATASQENLNIKKEGKTRIENIPKRKPTKTDPKILAR